MDTITITKKEYKKLTRKNTNEKSGKKGGGFSFEKIAPFVGMWKGRAKVKDTGAYVRDMRRREDNRWGKQ